MPPQSEISTKQLLYRELLQRPGGPWSWNEPGNLKERAMPRVVFGHLLEKCDLKTLCNVERVCLQWREYLAATDGVGAWQVGVHRELGPERIEKYKNALGLRSGQGWDAEKVDLTARNWKRIMRMHRATKMLPKYRSKPLITPLAGHSGPVLCMTLGGPYLFTGGADRMLLMYRVPILVNYTHEKGKGRPPPKPIRSFGPSGFAHTGPVLCVAAEREYVISGGVDGLVKMWKVESAPESSPYKVMEKHDGPVWSLCIIDHKKWCVSGGADRMMYLWDMDGPKGATPLQAMRGHSAGVTALCVSMKNDMVISASEDKTVRVWEPLRGTCYSVRCLPMRCASRRRAAS